MAEPLPSVLLPANPNAVVFSTAASVVFDRRPWGRVQELALGPVMTLHEACELPVVAGFGWRVGLDRKNRRTLNVSMYFALDGPVAAEHIDTLERSMAHNPVNWGTAHVERIPGNGVASLFATDGVCHALAQGAGGHVERLLFSDDGIHVETVDIEAAREGDGLVALPAVTGSMPPYDDADRHMERMRLAFAQTFARRIVEADGVVQPDEQRFMDEVFRPEALKRLGLDVPSVHAECLAAAVEQLPSRLGYHDKLALIGLFFSACYSDGTVDAREMRVLKDAAEALGVEKGRVVKYLQRFW